MLTGTIVLNSLDSPSVLDEIEILNRTKDEDWELVDIHATREQILQLSKHLVPGPWYMHFWNGDDVLVVFKERYFDIKYSDKTTWIPAVAYGKSIGIPEEQLDFLK
ncbi:MAG TPA: hypothetical protein VMT80_01290 [Candidatus Paceibacterota bacterium]|nr:hypothetical protein [Candidatus Paceibacterota bacterium]